MKRIISFLVLCFSVFLCSSQALITKPTSNDSHKTIKDFGAVPNDEQDDTWAFIKAGKYFSNLWDINGVPLKDGTVNFDYTRFSARLDIPSGTYHVGKQLTILADRKSTTYGEVFGYPPANAVILFNQDGAHKLGLDLMVLSNTKGDINQFVMKGIGKIPPVIKYNDGLSLGFFNKKGEPQFLTDENYNPYFGVNISSFLQTINCKNIVVENIEINGRNRQDNSLHNVNYGGGFGSHLIQFGASGMLISNTKNVTLNNLNIHHMTLDGIVYNDYYLDPEKYKKQELSNLKISNTICDFNRRQGFSWVGGRGIIVQNSTFNNTGQTVSGIAAGNPGAGVDIEPEKDPAGNDLWCMDARFINCEFINNKGNALVNDVTGHRSINITFDSCKFHDVDSYAVWVRGKAFTFNNCKIWGGFIHGNDGSDPYYATRFNNCDFADEEIKERPGVYNKGFALVESWQLAKRMEFNNCSFRTIHANQRLITISTPSLLEKEFSVFSNCSFTAGKDNIATNILFGCVFEKNNKIVSLNKTGVASFSINAITLTGSDKATMPYNFIIEGNILFSVANSNGNGSKQFILGRNGIGASSTDGYVNFSIGKNSCFYGYWDQTIIIGKNASFINKADGQLALLSGTINNMGKVMLENGSSTAFFNPIAVNSNDSKAIFYYNEKAKMEMNTFWSQILPGLGYALPMSRMKLSSNTKFKGGNSGIPPGRAIQ